MTQKGAAELIASSCASSFIVTGHSLGGAVAQLFSVIVNKKDNPLGWKRKVDALYVFGSTPIAKTRLSNEMSADGCFPGGSYVNVGDMKKKDFAHGVPYGAGFKHVYMPTLEVNFRVASPVNFGEAAETRCTSEIDFNVFQMNPVLHVYLGTC